MSKLLIKLEVCEDIMYSSYKMRNGQFFLSQTIKDDRKDHATKLFNTLKHPFQAIKQPRSDGGQPDSQTARQKKRSFAPSLKSCTESDKN